MQNAMPRPVYKPEDTLLGANINASLLDFWKWAFADLCDDDIKGIFAEWLVLQLLRIPGHRRVSWANSDIVTPDGVRIEVKASSYWQSWKLLDEFGAPRTSPLHPISAKTQVAFAGLRARDAVAAPDSSIAPDFKSHLYVFALQRETNPELWNAMDLTQWEFYTLPEIRLRQLGGRSVSLKTLRREQKKLSGSESLTAESFPAVARKLIEMQRTEMGVSRIEQAGKTVGHMNTDSGAHQGK
jgi:hypothetical protein